MKLRIGRAILVAGVVVLVAPRVHAQAAPAAPTAPTQALSEASYNAAIAQALGEYEAHHFEEALALFTRADALWPNARTLRGMGITECELRRYVQCIAHLGLALDSPVKPLTAELRAQSEQLLQRAQHYVSRVTLQIVPVVTSAGVSVDGAEIVLRPDNVLLLKLGEHTVEVQAEGFESEQRRLLLSGGEEQTLKITLRPVQQTVPAAALTNMPAQRTTERAAATPPGHDADDHSSVWKSPWLWTGAGAVVAGAIVAIALLSGGQSAAHMADPVTTANTPPHVLFMALH